MTDSMNFGPEWLRNLSSEGSTTGVNSGGSRCQLAEYRYGREEMLALFEKGLQTPTSLSSFSPIYSETSLTPLALEPPTEEERQWASRGPSISMSLRGGRGLPGERGGRVARGGRGTYQPYGRSTGYETGGGWGNGDQTEWSPRKDFSYNRSSAGAVDNWRRNNRGEDDEGWRSSGGAQQGRGANSGGNEKWNRNSWREGEEERGGQDKLGRSWQENQRGHRRTWESETDQMPEWATENLEGGGTFDATGAFHGSDDEQDGRGNSKKDHHLQKSVSQHNITNRNQHAPLSTSKSALSLSKPPSPTSKEKMSDKDEVVNSMNERSIKSLLDPAKEIKMESKEPPKQPESTNSSNFRKEHKKTLQNMAQFTNEPPNNREVDEDFDKLQEDLVLKLVVDEEPATNSKVPPHQPLSNGVQPPPNIPSIQEKWFYQDPQGDLQGAFLSTEMAEWFRAGYFTTNLFVRRQCDEKYYTLGDLVALCGGNPFQTTVPIAPLKVESKLSDEVLQYHQMLQTQMTLRQGGFGQGEHWNSLNNIQQRELMAQQLLSQRINPESYLQQPNAVNPMLHMLNQFQQVKMPMQQPVVEKSSNPIPCQLDTIKNLVQHIGLQNIPNRMQQQMGNHGQPLGTPVGLKHEPSSLPSHHGLPVNGIPGSGTIPVMPNNILGGLPNNSGLGKIDGDNNRNFLQFLQKPQMEQSHDLESMWRKAQFPTSQQNNLQTTSQWQPSDKPINMWDMPPQQSLQSHPDVLQMNKDNTNITKEKHLNEANKEAVKEEKRRKDLEEKQAKKEAEEKRRNEQKKMEAEKRQMEEKRKKEDDRIKRELEKAKKDADEKRMKELTEKRRLKELRKAEEEARKREELKRMEELEEERLAAIEREEIQKKQAAEYARQAALNNQRLSKAAPWSQPSSNTGLSLGEIQQLERERKATEAILFQQQRLQQQQLLEQISPEKPAGINLNWANKPMKPSQVRSFTEIQAEEQERLLKLKQANEKAMQKEKEAIPAPTSGIWSGQSLNWNHDTNSNKGFWDEPIKPAVSKAPEPKVIKPPVATAAPKPPANNKPTKSKSKKEGNQNNNSIDEFSEWCTITLSNMNTKVDIPTFISFLRDIESALDVREYCRDYLGDKPATQQFAAQFLEKRRSFKPKTTSHKDDMCSPAPAITPSSQHSTEFQEVKGKGKKCKKSKMLKMDNRILGFNVTAAQDRINVGDRDYGDT